MKEIKYNFSDKKFQPVCILCPSEKKTDTDCFMFKTSTDHVLYIECIGFSNIISSFFNEDQRELLIRECLREIVENKTHKECYFRIGNAASMILESGNNIVNTLLHNIDTLFSTANVDSEDHLYNSSDISDIKTVENEKDLSHRINNIDKIVKYFLKNNRIYAGLKFLKYLIPKYRYGFGARVFREEVCFQTSNIYWRYSYDQECDINGDILNKIVECLFLLLSSTGYSEPLINLYKSLYDNTYVKLNTQALVRIIEALVKHSEIQLLEPAIVQLRTLEPFHPIIGVANNTIRRIKVFDQISRTYNLNGSDIQNMAGIDFEKFLENQFIRHGFKVERTKASGDFGADLIVETKSGTRAAIQAKRFKQKTNLKAVQEVVASLSHYGADFGIVVATSGFFQSAIELAKTNNIELWDEEKLIRFLDGDLDFSMLGND